MTKRNRKHQPPRTNSVRSADELVNQVIDQFGLRRAVRGNQLVAAWQEVVGDRVSKHCVPVGVRGAALTIVVASSSWMHELSLIKHELLAKILAAVGEPRLFTELRFVLADGTPPAAAKPSAAIVRTKREPLKLQAATVFADIVSEVERVEDPELRNLIGAVRIRHGK